jgi:hypothetical protein
MKNDPLCIKEDVCDMAVCDGVSSCSHAVLKTAVLVQQSTNKQVVRIGGKIVCIEDGEDCTGIIGACGDGK